MKYRVNDNLQEYKFTYYILKKINSKGKVKNLIDFCQSDVIVIVWYVKIKYQKNYSKFSVNFFQDEATNYYSSDEKVIDIPDPEVLLWLRGKMECALVYALEDKRQE